MAVTTQDGHLLLYDLKKSQSTPVQTLEASPNKQAVYSAEFNLKQWVLNVQGSCIKYWHIIADKIPAEIIC